MGGAADYDYLVDDDVFASRRDQDWGGHEIVVVMTDEREAAEAA
jgi:hypothetical protein